jgi:hypothetical protein
LRFYSTADSGVIDLVCAPLDYGQVGEVRGGVNRYQLWDYTRNNGSNILSLLPEQILSLSVLGTMFNPAEFGAFPPSWSIPRDWIAASGSGTEIGPQLAQDLKLPVV